MPNKPIRRRVSPDDMLPARPSIDQRRDISPFKDVPRNDHDSWPYYIAGTFFVMFLAIGYSIYEARAARIDHRTMRALANHVVSIGDKLDVEARRITEMIDESQRMAASIKQAESQLVIMAHAIQLSKAQGFGLGMEVEALRMDLTKTHDLAESVQPTSYKKLKNIRERIANLKANSAILNEVSQ